MLSTDDEWSTEEEIQVIDNRRYFNIIRLRCFLNISIILCLFVNMKNIKINLSFCMQLFLALHGLRPVGINKVSTINVSGQMCLLMYGLFQLL